MFELFNAAVQNQLFFSVIEMLGLKIKSCKKHNNTVLVVYRSFSSYNTANFIKIINESLSKLRKHDKKLIYMAGDFNNDLLKYNIDINSRNLIDTAASQGFAQVISQPTRNRPLTCWLRRLTISQQQMGKLKEIPVWTIIKD